MKKIYAFLFAALMLSAATACVNELDQDISLSPKIEKGTMILTATLADNDGTRLILDESTGKLNWEKNDEIGIFSAVPGDKGSRFSRTGDDESSTATFSGPIPDGYTGGPLYGVHPYLGASEVSEFEGFHDGKLRLILTNGMQSYDKLGDDDIFGFKAYPHTLPMMGESFPMVARAEGNELHFYNACGGLKITVDHPGIIGVIIKNNDGGPLWGVMELSFDADGKPVMEGISIPDELDEMYDGEWKQDEFWVADWGSNYDYFIDPGEPYYALLPPMTYSQGLTITYRTASTKATYTITDPVEIKRSVFSRLTLKDKNLEFKPIEGNIQFSSQGFKEYCVANFDTNQDGEISYAEALEVKTIMLDGVEGNASTQAPKGYDIMFFENLEIFWCSGTAQEPASLGHVSFDWLPKLKQIVCNYAGISGNVDLVSLKNLQGVYLEHNSIGGLRLGSHPVLSVLTIHDNGVSSLDLSGCPALAYLYTSYNSLTKLDVSKCPALKTFTCYGNYGLTSLDLSKSPSLSYVACCDCNLNKLIVKNMSDLQTLYCYNNQIETLDLSDCSALRLLSCWSNNLSALDMTPLVNLAHAYVSYNPIGSIDVTKCTALETLYCCINNLEELDISQNPSLKWFRCFDNNLTSLDLSTAPELEMLWAGGNPMTELDVSANPVLSELDMVYTESGIYDTYTSPLQYLYVAEGQIIPGVTENRSEDLIPVNTVITVK